MDDRKSRDKPLETSANQIDRFKELARELDCDEDEAAFDTALKRVAEAKPGPKYEPKKRPAKNKD